MRILRTTIVLATVTCLAACSGLSLLNALVPNGTYVRTADLSYAELPRQQLDVYVPSNSATAAPKPVVLFFYGGGWESGSRADYRFIGESMTAQGFVAVVPDYRVYPDVLFPEFVADAAKAVRWVKDNIARYGGDPARVFLMGHSAGAHIAAMLTLDKQYLQAVGMSPAELRGVIGLAGPYDFLPVRSNTLKVIFGPEPERWRSQPINYVDGANPPMLLVTGDADGTVSPGNTRRLAAKIKANGGPVDVIEYPGLGHGDVVVLLATPFFVTDGQLLRAVTQFVRER